MAILFDTFTATSELLNVHVPDVHGDDSSYAFERMNTGYNPTDTAYVSNNVLILDQDGQSYIIDSGVSDNFIIKIDWTPKTGGLNRNSIIFRNVDYQNKVHVRIRRDTSYNDLLLMYYIDGTEYSYTVVNDLFNLDQTYEIKVIVNGTLVKVYVDDVEKISQVANNHIAATKVGFSRNTGSSATGLDNFNVSTWLHPIIVLSNSGFGD